MPLFTGSKSGPRTAQRLKILLRIGIYCRNSNTFIVVTIPLLLDPESTKSWKSNPGFGSRAGIITPLTCTFPLQVHFFGKDDKHHMHFEEFSAFVSAIQREVLRAEFLEYSRGLDKVSVHCEASTQLRDFVLFSFGSSGFQWGCTVATVSAQLIVEHVKNNLQNIMTEWTPYSVTFHHFGTKHLIYSFLRRFQSKISHAYCSATRI